MDSSHQKSTLLRLKNRHKPCVLMLFHPLSALEGFPKNQSQHLIWRGICNQTTYLNTKNGGIIENNCPFEPTVAPSPSLQVLLRGVCKCNLEEETKKPILGTGFRVGFSKWYVGTLVRYGMRVPVTGNSCQFDWHNCVVAKAEVEVLCRIKQ